MSICLWEMFLFVSFNLNPIRTVSRHFYLPSYNCHLNIFYFFLYPDFCGNQVLFFLFFTSWVFFVCFYFVFVLFSMAISCFSLCSQYYWVTFISCDETSLEISLDISLEISLLKSLTLYLGS